MNTNDTWAKLRAYKTSPQYANRVIAAFAIRALFRNVGRWSAL
jgi:hypothetical protein